ncbi:hypothetical protein EcWhh1_91 [Escherichia phage EcWhh-1]|nr:hypothetical protein EcWhh1_91 [Escherichia phage EcWhh-1]
MINYMNVGDEDIKDSYLQGNHVADKVYCVDVIKSDKATGHLFATDVIFDSVENLKKLDHSKLSENSRIYFGNVHVEELYIGGDYESVKSGTSSTVEDADIYPEDI